MSCGEMYDVHIVKGGYQIVVVGGEGGSDSVWWIIIAGAVGNDSAQLSTMIVAAGNNSMQWVIMVYGGATC